MTACDACLRRAWLLGRLSGHLDLARAQGRRLREVLALAPEALLDALGGADRTSIDAALRAAGLPGQLRAAVAGRGLAVVCAHDDGYPARLRDLDDRPAALFVLAAGGPDVLGRLVGGDLDDGPAAAAVVGTRRASAEGLEIARGLGRGLSAAGVAVVSGMALGIDSAAHEGALAAGGRTVAVLACSADAAYPRRKASLHAAIARAGAVVSELPPGAEPRRWAFPARNRIIAALAGITVVVEAAERSGSLITAELAGDAGREVGAVPGPVLSWRSAGTNALLRDGATLIRDTSDVLDAVLGVELRTAVPAPPGAGVPDHLAPLLRAVGGGADTVDALATTPVEAERVVRGLAELEVLGALRREGPRWIVAAR